MVLVSVPCDGAAPSRCGALDIVPLDASLYVGGGCPSLLTHRAVTQMVVYMDVDATVSVQRAATTSGVGSM
jgi:hypothetical protein